MAICPPPKQFSGELIWTPQTQSTAHQGRALWLSTISFTICFAVWTIFSIIGIRIKQELGLNDTQFGLLVGTPILSGSLIRLVLGIWTDQYGGRRVYTVVMLAAAVATYLLTWAHTYPEFLVAALFVGIAGGSFAVGIAYVSRFYPTGKQGTALGIFGAGNVGAAVTKFVAPFVLVAYGWQTVAQVWALVIGLMGIVFWIFSEEDPVVRARRETEREAEKRMAGTRAAEERPGLALRAVLFLRVRRLRRAVAVAAAISDQGLRRRHRDRRHDGGDVLVPRQRVPGLWRPSFGSLWRAPRDVLDVPGRESSAPSFCPIRRPIIW